MQIQKTNQNFQGVRFPAKVGTKDLEKIKNFISNEKNIDLVKKLDRRETDIYLSEGIKEVGFAHQRYGYLSNYGASNVPVSEFSNNVEKTLLTVNNAIRKVQRAWSQVHEQRRGC